MNFWAYRAGNASHSNNTYGDANEAGVPWQEGPEVNFTMGSEDSGERETERRENQSEERIRVEERIRADQRSGADRISEPVSDSGQRRRHAQHQRAYRKRGACAAVIRSGNDFGLETEGYQEGDIISEVSGRI